MHVVSNIDFLWHGISDEIIEEIFYKLEPLHINQGNYLFKSGKQWKDLFIVASGEVDVSIINVHKKETFLDHLYQGCIIGTYSVLTGDPYSINGRAKTDWVLLRLSHNAIEELRERYQDLDFIISEYEQYIDEEGLPYCDFKLYRSGLSQMEPLKKFQWGIRRIIRIVVRIKPLYAI